MKEIYSASKQSGQSRPRSSPGPERNKLGCCQKESHTLNRTIVHV